jgi:hypothetical protein
VALIGGLKRVFGSIGGHNCTPLKRREEPLLEVIDSWLAVISKRFFPSKKDPRTGETPEDTSEEV